MKNMFPRDWAGANKHIGREGRKQEAVKRETK